MTRFAELVCRTAFSFHEGTSLPEDIVAQAAALGLTSLAITDRDGVYGIPRAHRAAKQLGIHIIPGALLTIEGGPGVALLAQDMGGWSQLSRLITEARKNTKKGWGQIPFQSLIERSGGLEAILLGSWSLERAHRIREAFGERVSLALTRRLDGNDVQRWDQRAILSGKTQIPLVATGDVLMHVASKAPLQDVLTCIRRKCTIDQAGTQLQSNASRTLRSAVEIGRLFEAAPQAIDRSMEIAERCHFSLHDLRYRYPKEIVPEGWSPMKWLTHQTQQGLKWRYPNGTPPSVVKQVEHELALIEQLDFPAYFLTVYDVVRFARDNDILCQGRGSAANSAVCFALGITAVDPATSTLLFERFISAERGEPPDIDVDFEHERREEVLQYVYERYGRHRAAMVNEVISYRRRSAIRDAGKVMGLDPDQIDRLAKENHWFERGEVDNKKLHQMGLDPNDNRLRQTIKISEELRGLPRHIGIHTGGFTISDGPLIDLCPIEPATMANRTVIQWDKDDIDIVGFIKVDLLSLGMLTAIRKSFDLIEKHCDQTFCLSSIPNDDVGTYDMICQADTIGVFQIESRAQMSMLPRMRPRCFYDLVIQVSIVRPGPIQGGMVHPYLRRRRGDEPVTYAHPSLEPILKRTMGVPIFQEQVMAMAVAVGNFTPGEADELRRAMGAWRKHGTLGPLAQRLTNGMRENGIDSKYAVQICKQIEGFGEYGFPESHAASFSRLVYVSAWLKHHHPAAFCVALLNSQPMGFYSPRSLIDDARRHHVQVEPIDIQMSAWDNTLEEGHDNQLHIRLGFRQIRGLSRKAGLKIEHERNVNGPFVGIGQLQKRADLHRGEMDKLAHAGALQSLVNNRRDAIWAVRGLYDLPLFRGIERPQSVSFPAPNALDEMNADYRSVGLSLKYNPVELERKQLTKEGFLPAAEVKHIDNGRTVRVAGVVAHRQRPSTANGIIFMTLEDETGLLNIVVKPALFEKQRAIILRHNLLKVTARVQRDGASISLLASHFIPLMVHPPDNIKSRDFR